jgi:hypothetical protein
MLKMGDCLKIVEPSQKTVEVDKFKGIEAGPGREGGVP